MPYGKQPRPPNARQRRFIDAYLSSDDAASAAVAAGYSPSTAKKNASGLLRCATVAAVLRSELDARAERTRIAADRIVLELARVAFSDITRIADWDDAAGWVPRAPGALAEADRAAIARITRHGGHVTIALHDKIRALDTLGKYFKLWGKHADKFGPPGGGAFEPRMSPLEQREAARDALRKQIERVLGERKARERAAKLREEEEWAAAWKSVFG